MLRTQSISVSQICSLSLTLETPNTCWFAKWLMVTLTGSLGVAEEFVGALVYTGSCCTGARGM